MGKSTFVRFTINSLLNRFDEVACLDLDPGQPEFTLPSCISLTIVNKPILGPPYFHRNSIKPIWQKQVFLGENSVDMLLEFYVKKVESLITEGKSKQIPIVVNTMGYVTRLASDIMVDLLRAIQPTHVLTLESRNYDENFPQKLTPLCISSRRGLGHVQNWQEPDFDLTGIPSTAGSSHKFHNKNMRDLRIMSYFSSLWPVGETDLTKDNMKDSIEVPFSSVALCDLSYFESSESPCSILPRMNGCLIALCRLPNDFVMQDVASNFLILRNEDDWFNDNEFIQWALVKNIDDTNQFISLLTPMMQEELQEAQMNFIIKPKAPALPKEFYQLFPIQEGML